MVPELGFVNGVIIDQHFARRGRLRRLLGAVAQNPRLLGVGIDDDTRGEPMNNVSRATWVVVAILLAIILAAFIATRGGQ